MRRNHHVQEKWSYKRGEEALTGASSPLFFGFFTAQIYNKDCDF